MINLNAYQKLVLKAYQEESPSFIDLDKNYLKFKKRFDHIFFFSLNLGIDFFKNKTVLDCGCGTGEYDILFSDYGAKKVVGLDFNYKSINQANIYKKKFLKKNIFFKIGDILKINSEKKYDIIFCNGVIPHLSHKDQINFIRKIKKNLNKNGFLIISFLDNAGNILKLLQPKIINFLYKGKEWNFKFLKASQLFSESFKRFKKFGLRNKKNVFYDFFVNNRSFGFSSQRLLKICSDLQLHSSSPYKSQFSTITPANFFTRNNKITFDYYHYFLQQLSWINNQKILSNKNFHSRDLFERFEKSIIHDTSFKQQDFIKLIDKINLRFNKDLNLFKEVLNKIFFIKNLILKKKHKNLIIFLNKNKKLFSGFCGIGTVYYCFKKN